MSILNTLINKYGELETDRIGSVVCYQIIACPKCNGAGRGQKLGTTQLMCELCGGRGTAEKQIDTETALKILAEEKE